MFNYLRQSFSFLMVMTLLTGILYPLSITAASQAAFPHQANGSLIMKGDTVVGSELIGQQFASNRYFHGRPSAAGKGYDAAASAGSNYGPLNEDLLKRVATDADAIRKLEGLAPDSPLPSDSVLASASGLDPHISVETARMQVSRIAKARGLDRFQVEELVADITEKQLYGIPETARINVLKLNLALDTLK